MDELVDEDFVAADELGGGECGDVDDVELSGTFFI